MTHKKKCAVRFTFNKVLEISLQLCCESDLNVTHSKLYTNFINQRTFS